MTWLFLQVAGYEMACDLALSYIKIGEYHFETVRFLLQIKALEAQAKMQVYKHVAGEGNTQNSYKPLTRACKLDYYSHCSLVARYLGTGEEVKQNESDEGMGWALGRRCTPGRRRQEAGQAGAEGPQSHLTSFRILPIQGLYFSASPTGLCSVSQKLQMCL